MTRRRVLVTGGTGFIGSHTCVDLMSHGYDVTILDNLSNSDREVIDRIESITGVRPHFVEADLARDPLTEVLGSARFDGVLHFAALKSVAESVTDPIRYYEVNLGGTSALLKWMEASGSSQIVFSSSATVYGLPSSSPVSETAPVTPINPYGETKLACERLIRAWTYAEQGRSCAILRYFNPVGAHPSGLIGESPRGIPANLVPFLGGVLSGKYPAMRVFGNDYPTRDGTGIRDYIHVLDLAEVHRIALEALNQYPALCLNVGTGRGYSVLEVVAAFEKACGKSIPLEILERRAGDAPEVYADTQLAHSVLGWRAQYDLARMCEDSIRWYLGAASWHKSS